MNPVSDRDVPPDSVNHVVINLLGAGRSSESQNGMTPFIWTDFHRFDHPDLISGAVIDQERPAVFQTIQPDRAGIVIQDLVAEPAIDLVLTGE